MIYKNNPDITEVIFIVPGENLARDMWYGCRTQHLRKSYERQGISLEQLENFWYDLAAENNMPYLGTKMSLYFGKADKIIPYKLGSTLSFLFKKNNFNVLTKFFSFLGHYLIIFWFLLYPRRFIENSVFS